MQVTLVGPDDLGKWHLDSEQGNSFPLIEEHEDHPKGAGLLGWTAPEGNTDEDELIESALDWLMDHTGDDFETDDKEVVEYFRELEEEDEE